MHVKWTTDKSCKLNELQDNRWKTDSFIASSELTNDGQFEISPDLNKLCCELKFKH